MLPHAAPYTQLLISPERKPTYQIVPLCAVVIQTFRVAIRKAKVAVNSGTKINYFLGRDIEVYRLTASNFRVGDQAKYETSRRQTLDIFPD